MLTAAALSTPPATLMLAEAASSGGFDPYSLIGTAITPVIVVVLMLAGKLHTHGEIERLALNNEQLREQNQAMQAALIERAVPALTRSTMVLEQITPLIQNEVRLRSRGDG